MFKKTAFIQKLTQPVILFLLFVLCYIVLKIYVLEPTQNNVSYLDNNFSVLGLNIPSNLHFCGERIPSNSYEIKKDLDKEFFNNTYWKNNSQLLFHKAQRWFPYIEPILKQEGVPDDFKYLAVIESHLSNVNSPVGAAGFWQLVPVTAGYYGLEVNANVDERYHVEKSTRVACQLIKQAYKVFKNWTLTAAAYNRGIGGILRAMKQQGTNDYHKLVLNPETGSFVYRILAYKTLFSSPSHFGIKKKKWSYFPKIAYTVYKVDSTITDLDGFARLLGVRTITLKQFNPWLIGGELPNPAKKTYEIRIPKNRTADYTGYVRDLLPGSVFVFEPVADTSASAKNFPDSLNPSSPQATAQVASQQKG